MNDVGLYKTLHKGKSDDELREIISRNNKLTEGVIYAVNPSPRDLAQAEAWQYEATACREILESRRAEQEQIKKGGKIWRIDRCGIGWSIAGAFCF